MLTVDPSLPTPPFEQVKEQVTELRTTGALPAHHRLPTVRHLAAELGLAPSTVARAYRELEASGVIETRGRHGSFITPTSPQTRTEGVRLAHDYVRRLRALGVADADAVRLVRDAIGGLPAT